MCETAEPNKPQKPLTNIQVWGLEEEDMPGDIYDDEMIEDMLADEMDAEIRATENVQIYERCSECGAL